jgi:NADPH2:quinone reductase
VFDAPEGLDDVEAAAFILPFHTSHLALFRRGRLAAGETLVVHSAASGLGTAGIQLGKAAGARVIAVAGGPEKGALCTRLGADLVIDHSAEDFVEAVLQATGDVGAEVVYDLAGGDFVERSWRCTARGGRYLAVGYADDNENGMTGRPLRMASIGNIDLVGVMVAWVDAVDPGMRRFGFNPYGRDVADEVHSDLLRLVAEGAVRPHVGRRVSMEEAGVALEKHRARRAVGRTVVVVGD